MKYIIFDIDGTLTNTTKIDDQCYMESFESLFGVSIKQVKWSQIENVTDWGITEELVQSKLKRKITEEDIHNLKKVFLSRIQGELNQNKSNFNEIDGASLFYKWLLKDTNFKIGIATGGWEETAVIKLEAIGIDPNSVGFSNSNKFKEREKIILDVIDQLHAMSSKKPEEIIYIGDGQWDFETSRSIGVRFIGIDNENNGKLKSYGVREVYRDFQNKEAILKSIKSKIK